MLRTVVEIEVMKAKGDHDSELGYTTGDDGVHLECVVCDVSVNLGFFGSLELANDQWAAHLRGEW